MPEAPQRTRLLSHFSQHGVELLLERLGLLDQLRLRGFRHPSVEVDLSGTVGDTVRIYSEPDHGELLMELRVNRGSRVVPGCRVLVVEWLLLQNPRAHFGLSAPPAGAEAPRARSPQRVFGWLVAMAEVLDLDGIYYVPSSYHVAIQSRRRVRFLEPEDEALIQSLETLVRGRVAVGGEQSDRRRQGGGRGDRCRVDVAGISRWCFRCLTPSRRE